VVRLARENPRWGRSPVGEYHHDADVRPGPIGGRRMKTGSPSFSVDRLELAKWLITRTDLLRMSLASRAAVILSADAIIAGGATILSTRLSDGGLWGGRATLGVLILISIGSLVLAALSIANAVQGIVNIVPSRKVFGQDEDVGLFFDPSNTARLIDSTAHFRQEFRRLDDRAALDYALADLWKVTTFHYHRYQSLRRAAKLLLAALSMFTATAVASLAFAFLNTL
jgi:hypothetical protein